MSRGETARKGLALFIVFLAGTTLEVPSNPIQQKGASWALIAAVGLFLLALGLILYDE